MTRDEAMAFLRQQLRAPGADVFVRELFRKVPVIFEGIHLAGEEAGRRDAELALKLFARASTDAVLALALPDDLNPLRAVVERLARVWPDERLDFDEQPLSDFSRRLVQLRHRVERLAAPGEPLPIALQRLAREA